MFWFSKKNKKPQKKDAKKGDGKSQNSSNEKYTPNSIALSDNQIKNVQTTIESLFDSILVLVAEGITTIDDKDNSLLEQLSKKTGLTIEQIIASALGEKHKKLFIENVNNLQLTKEGLLKLLMKESSPFNQYSIQNLECALNDEHKKTIILMQQATQIRQQKQILKGSDSLFAQTKKSFMSYENKRRNSSGYKR